MLTSINEHCFEAIRSCDCAVPTTNVSISNSGVNAETPVLQGCWIDINHAISQQGVLGCFFGLGLEVFAGCGLKWFKMVGKGWKRLEKYQKVWESTRKYFRVPLLWKLPLNQHNT
jgi:hypothetical protein